MTASMSVGESPIFASRTILVTGETFALLMLLSHQNILPCLYFQLSGLARTCVSLHWVKFKNALPDTSIRLM